MILAEIHQVTGDVFISGTQIPELSNDDRVIHVWRAQLDSLHDLYSALAGFLSDGEQSKAHEFASPQVRDQFQACRGIMRFLAGSYLGINPKTVALTTDPSNKPYVAKTSGKGQLQLNLSHSGDTALFAFCWNHKVGVDIEKVRPSRNLVALAKRTLCEHELEIFSAIPVKDLVAREDFFYRCWTRKEALMKAVGTGISFSLLGELDVSRGISKQPSPTSKVYDFERQTIQGQEWDLGSLDLSGSERGALAVSVSKT